MEEKLYFKPANYGKGKRKQTRTELKDKKGHKALKFVCFLLFLVIIIIIIIWLLHGNTTTTGQYPENVKNESLVCASNEKTYEKANQVDSENKEFKLSMVFYGKEKLSSISLKYTLVFGTNSEAYSSEALAHAQFNLDLQGRGYNSGMFNNKFTLMDNKVIISLHADYNDLNDLTKEYFLINREKSPTTLSEYRANFESQGFVCESSSK